MDKLSQIDCLEHQPVEVWLRREVHTISYLAALELRRRRLLIVTPFAAVVRDTRYIAILDGRVCG
jgi:hypothetical protein